MKAPTVLKDYLRTHRLVMTGLAFLSILGAGLSLAQPLLLQRLFDGLSGSEFPSLLAGTLTVLVIFQAGLGGYESYLLNKTSQGFIYELRRLNVRKVAHLPFRWINEIPPGELISRGVTDPAAASTILTTGVFQLLGSLLMFLAAALFMLFIDPVLFGFAVGATLISALISAVSARLVRRSSGAAQEAISKLTGALNRLLLSLPLLRAYGATDRQASNVEIEADRTRKAFVRVGKISAFVEPLLTVSTQALLIVTLALGGYRVANGDLSIGELIAFVMYLMMMAGPVSQAGSTFVGIQTGLAALDRIQRIQDEPAEPDSFVVEEPDLKERADTPILDLVSVHLGFGSSRAPQAVIGPLSFQVQANEKVALVGPSGSGKSTVLNLIEQFYTPDSGCIFLHGRPQRAYSLDDYRGCFAYVSQNSTPLGGTIRDNLRMGNPQVEDLEMLDVLHDVGFPGVESAEVLDRVIDDQGAGMSGGEKQRLGLARAFLSDREILLLDEPTANLDALSAERVSASVAEYTRNRALLTVSHRIREIADYDRIVVLSEGQIVGVGTHTTLLASCGLYRGLAQQQGMFV